MYTVYKIVCQENEFKTLFGMKKGYGNFRLQRLLERVLGIERKECENLKNPHAMTQGE